SQSFYHILAAGFGMPINQLPFEMLARSLPLKLIRKQASSPFQVEALVFGQAGLLEGTPLDRYQASLQSEYQHLARKFGLHPIDGSIWHFLRLRPASFPTVRLAQFAALWSKHAHLFASIKELRDKDQIKEVLSVEVTTYWQEHFRFGKVGRKVPHRPGSAFMERLIANALVPFLYFYQHQRGLEEPDPSLFELLSSCKGEKNKILENWQRLGMPNHNAYDSQALLQWKKQYCDYRKCLDCVVGKVLFETKVPQ
ncbi:MAG: DUF2851 family protein, partial [Bacteroidota bacterium]